MDTDLRKCITGTGPEPESRKADIPTAIRNFEKNRFTVKHFATKEEAADYLSETIRGKTVGFGDSATLAAMKIAERLSEHNLVIDPASHPDDIFMLTAKGAMDTQVFLLSVNAASETGELVNIDSSGNRVGGSLFSFFRSMPRQRPGNWSISTAAETGSADPCSAMKRSTMCFLSTRSSPPWSGPSGV